MSDRTLLRWSIPDLRQLTTLRTSQLTDVIAFDSMGDHMVVSLAGGGVELWTKPWRAPQELIKMSHGIYDFDFAPDNRWFAVATRDGGVSAWSSSGSVLGEPVRLDGLAFAIALDGHGLLAGSIGGTSARWTLPRPSLPRQHLLGEPVWNAWFQSEEAFVAHGDSKELEPGHETTTLRALHHDWTAVSRDRRMPGRNTRPARMRVRDK